MNFVSPSSYIKLIAFIHIIFSIPLFVGRLSTRIERLSLVNTLVARPEHLKFLLEILAKEYALTFKFFEIIYFCQKYSLKDLCTKYKISTYKQKSKITPLKYFSPNVPYFFQSNQTKMD